MEYGSKTCPLSDASFESNLSTHIMLRLNNINNEYLLRSRGGFLEKFANDESPIYVPVHFEFQI